MSKMLKVAGTITLLLLLAAFAMAAANAQTYPKPTNVTATNTTDGHVLVSWADDAAPVHRVGWTHSADARAANAAGDWLEAFHFADSKRNTDYTIKYLPRGQQYWIIVGATNERFAGASWSEWKTLTTTGDSATDGDYDADDDGLIEVSNLAQLNAMRHDLDGDGSSTHPVYAAAFTDAIDGMGCHVDGCTGYELTADLDFDTNGNGQADAGDVYWNNGFGWEPIGDKNHKFVANFHGGGNTIANLYIDRQHQHVGLFGYIGSGSIVQQVGLLDANISGFWDVGPLAGWNAGVIKDSYAKGQVSGPYAIGGLVGWNGGTIIASYAVGSITGVVNNSGGLIAGTSVGSTITSSYAKVDIFGGTNIGGLVGEFRTGTINDSYATGNVRGSWRVGGLVGLSNGSADIVNSYSTGNVTGDDTAGGLIGKNDNNRLTVTNSYWDTRSSRISYSDGGVGKTTADLQSPTSNTGIYASWNPDLWDFGTSLEYPALKYMGLSAAAQRP